MYVYEKCILTGHNFRESTNLVITPCFLHFIVALDNDETWISTYFYMCLLQNLIF